MSDHSVDKLKFHWNKWRDESKAFWGRATLSAALLLISVAFQFEVISVDTPLVKLNVAHDPVFYRILNLLSWELLGFLIFKFVDLLRHRVPEEMEEEIHTNKLPNSMSKRGLGPVKFDLQEYGRLLYLLFPLYAATMAGLLFAATIYVWFIYK